MLRATVINLDEDEHVLVVTMHHIASDGWSTSIIVKELVELYSSFEENRLAVLPSLSIQYADYSIWQRSYLDGETLSEKVAYWKEKLKDVAPLRLLSDHPRPAVQSTRGAIKSFRINKDLLEELQQLSQQQGATMFMTLLAAFKVLLYRYSAQDDICVGTPIANRTQRELEGLVGFFLNTLAIRSRITSDDPFTILLEQVKTTTLEAYANQEIPFEKVVDAVVKERDMSRSPLFQVMFTLQNTPEIPQLRLGELSLLREGYEHTTSKFDLSFTITESPAGLQGFVQYCTDLYSDETIGRMISNFQELLGSIATAPHQKIASLGVVTQEEQHRLLVEFNDNVIDYPRNTSITALF
jgi:hypothetical protein